MSLKDFRALDINEQAVAVWTGTFLDTVVETKHNVYPDNVHNFYFKVHYPSKLNEIVKIRAFKNTKLIAAYLDILTLDSLNGLL